MFHRFAFSLTALALPMALVACVNLSMPPADPMPPQPFPSENACGADELQDLVGQPASRLQTIRFGVATRIIRPGMAVTMDYSPFRLNIFIDDFERITAVRCG